MALHNLMDSEPSPSSSMSVVSDPVLLAAAHSKMDEHHVFRGNVNVKVTKPTRVALNQRINSLFKNRTVS